jgi:uncharacterized protein YutE (UPF0331/DUF86 family)
MRRNNRRSGYPHWKGNQGAKFSDSLGANSAMRNRLVHLYFDIDLDQVWKAVTEDLPALVKQLQEILETDSSI